MKSDRLLEAIGFINDEAIQDAKAYRRPKSRRWFRLYALVAAIILLSTTAMATWMFLRPAEILERMEDHTLSDAFDSEKAININVSATSGEYTFTLLAIVSGEDISDYLGSVAERKPERTYIVLTMQKTDGTPIQEETYEELNQFMVTPLIKGEDPSRINVVSMGGSFSSSLVNGVVYRLVECDNVMMFADRGLYLGVCSSMFVRRDTFKFDEITGEIAVNPDYSGISVVFELPIDVSYADPERAEQYLGQLYRELCLEDAPDTEVNTP